jgi:hypothetical protein
VCGVVHDVLHVLWYVLCVLLTLSFSLSIRPHLISPLLRLLLPSPSSVSFFLRYEDDVDADSSSESFEDVTSFGVRLERAEEQVR